MGILGTLTSPRVLGSANGVLLVLNLATFIYVPSAFPSGIFNCGGITIGFILLAAFALFPHACITAYLLPAVLHNAWPWNLDVDAPYVVAAQLATYRAAKGITDTSPMVPTPPVVSGKATKRGSASSLVKTESTPLLASVEASAQLTASLPAASSGAAGEESEFSKACSQLDDVADLAAMRAEAARRCNGPRVYRRLGLGVCTLAVVAVYAFAIISLWLRGTIPDLKTSFTLPGLHSDLSLYREDSGLVHVYGSDLHDTFFGQGFAHAQLRLWQLEFQRRVGAGTLAEVAGSAALDIDKAMRTLGVYPAAVAAFDSLSLNSQTILNAYVEGINAYITGVNDGSQSLPLEFRILGFKPSPWTVTDSLVWTKLMSYSLSGNMDDELTRYKLSAQQNLSDARIDELMPPFDTAHFPTVLSDADLALPYGPGTPSAQAFDEGVWAHRVPTGSLDTSVHSALAQAREVEASIAARVARAQPHAGGVSSAVQPESKSEGQSGWIDALFSRFQPNVKMTRSYGGAPYLGFRNTKFGASNNWVVGPNHTATGGALLNNDPHLQFMAPSIWILQHLHCQTTGFNVVGASFLGLPGVVLGHNDAIAWGVTNTGADVQDLYIMEGNETHYLYDGVFTPYQLDVQTIKVAGSADVSITVRTSAYGRVVTDNGFITDINVPMSLRWVSTDANISDSTLDAFLNINFASDWSSFRTALSSYIAPSQNFIFADTSGNIGYQMSGYVPSRNPGVGYTGGFPSRGDGNTTFMWGPRIPYDAMPRTYNPVEGFVASANNRVTPPDYPLFITYDWDEGSDGYRAARITQMIQAQDDHTTDTMISIQQDYTSHLARDVTAIIANTTTPDQFTAGGNGLRMVLLDWEHTLPIGSTIASLWASLWRKLAGLGQEESGEDYWGGGNFVFVTRALMSNATDPDPACLKKGYPNCNAFLVASIEQVASTYGVSGDGSIPPSTPLWGTGLHTATFSHQLLSGSPLECLSNRNVYHGGDDSTVNVGHMDLTEDLLPQGAGPSFRHICDASSMQNSKFIHPMGQDGNLLSFQYDNLLQDWALGGYLPMLSDLSRFTALGVTKQMLSPA